LNGWKDGGREEEGEFGFNTNLGPLVGGKQKREGSKVGVFLTSDPKGKWGVKKRSGTHFVKTELRHVR